VSACGAIPGIESLIRIGEALSDLAGGITIRGMAGFGRARDAGPALTCVDFADTFAFARFFLAAGFFAFGCGRCFAIAELSMPGIDCCGAPRSGDERQAEAIIEKVMIDCADMETPGD